MIKILSLLIALSPAVSAGQAAPEADMTKYICDGAYFTAMIPSDWEKEDEVAIGRAEKQYGVDLYAPGQPPAATISLIYFGPDHKRFKTAEKYIATQKETKDRIPGEASGKVSDTVVNNRYAKAFDKRSYEMVPAYSPKAQKVEMLERFVVIPAKAGFYSLSFKAPKGEAKRYLAVFEKILKTFKPAR